VSGKARSPQHENAAMLAARDRAAARIPPLVRALLDARDDPVVIFGVQGEIVYLNAAAETALLPPGLTPLVEGGRFRAVLVARGGRVVPLRWDSKVLGEMIVLPRPSVGPWVEQEREAIRDALHQTGGRRAEAARRLGISRTTLWRRLRGARKMNPPATR
jgi:Bacterial regulatory protein, Fis family